MANDDHIKVRFLRNWAGFKPGDIATLDAVAARQVESRGVAVRVHNLETKTKPITSKNSVTKG